MSTTPTPPVEPLKLVAIVTKETGTFICAASTGNSWSRPTITGCLFDGQKAVLQPTRVDHWYKIPAVPTKVQQVKPAVVKTIAFTLLPGFAPSEKLPARIVGSTLSDTPHEGVSECYQRETETAPETYVDVPFELHVIAERERFEIVKADFNLTYGLIDQLTLDPVLLQERPCKLDARQSYTIIRNHVKTHINPTWAAVTSDYDFCFTVEKRIPLAAAIPFQRETRVSARKTKMVTDYRHHRTVKVYETAPPDQYGKPYNGYTLTEPFVGTSYEDLQAKIKTFLDALMAKINEPIKDCPHCGGKGVIVEPPTP